MESKFSTCGIFGLTMLKIRFNINSEDKQKLAYAKTFLKKQSFIDCFFL